jgi:hypothetical protein
MNGNESPDQDKSEAQKLLDSRLAVYGDRVDNMQRTAKIWSGLTGFDIQPWQVPVMFAAYKLFRLNITPDYSDNIDDADGYLVMFREVIGDDMVQARTVEEYLKAKADKNDDNLDVVDPFAVYNPPARLSQEDGQGIDAYLKNASTSAGRREAL